ncbi:unnamed protein product [Strongylus vulgaris]|uniref:C2 domain-containing protein n=1 Tax=Strongylus vulgaris TaxID=40348 RepID=A0A3P7LHP9_STRVU|nr:unnamed protein product [Strongylus vulgaris]
MTHQESVPEESSPPTVATSQSTPDDLSMETIQPGSANRRRMPSTLGSIQFTVFYNQQEKKLTVHLIRAKNLKAMDSNGFSDPYVKLHLLPGNAKATKLTSKTIEKTLNPEWNEELHYYGQEKKLTVHLIRAKNLKAMDSNGFSDPYVKLHLLPGNAKATKLTSKTIEKTLNPEWNEELHYYGVTEEDKQRKTLRITVLDRDRIGSDFLGETRIALKKLPMNTLKKFNLYLEHAIPVPQSRQEQESIRGKILVGLQYNIQQGSLFVTIKRCAELLGMDSTGFSDPYCKTLTFVVPFKDLPKKTLQIGVYDHDLGKHDDYIGGIVLSTSAKDDRGGIVLSTSAKDDRGKQWINCIENPGRTFEVWHHLELDS